MWHSLEARVPFLDDDLVDYVMRLPHTYKIKKGTTKFFLRDLLSDYLPHKILNGRKRSFGTPVNNWLSTSLFNYTEEVFKKGEKAEYPIDYKLLLFNLHNFKRTKDTHLGSLIWKILILTLWFDQYDKKLKF
jgi:asparagine synthase (glutamine-hydrolysing)